MSMKDYAVDDYGLLMAEETLKIIASQYCEDYTEEGYDDDEFHFNEKLYEAGVVDYIGEFTGEAMEIDNDGKTTWNTGEMYDWDYIYYVPVSRTISLFKAAYNNMDELVDEFKEKLCKYLPDDFDYRGNIRRIVGTYYG